MKSYWKIVCALVGASLAATAQTEGLIPQIATGTAGPGAWTTNISFLSLEDDPVDVDISFFTQAGTPWMVDAGDAGIHSQFTLSVAADGTVDLFLDAVNPLQVGYAKISANGAVSASAVFRQRVNDRPDFEAVVPMQTGASREWVVRFDNTQNYATSLAIVNPNNVFANIEFWFFDENQQTLAQQIVALPPNNHTAFATTAQFPVTAGHTGVLRISAPTDLNVLALSFNPGGAFTSVIPTLRDGSTSAGPDLTFYSFEQSSICNMGLQFIINPGFEFMGNDYCPYEVTLEVGNAGLQPSAPTTALIRFNPSGDLDDSDETNLSGFSVHYAQIPALAPGETVTLVQTVWGRLEDDCDGSPSCTIVGGLDPNQNVTESDESNNIGFLFIGAPILISPPN